MKQKKELYSNAVDELLSEMGYTKENVIYMTIVQNELNKIRSGKKKVEYRALTAHYLTRLCRYDKNNNWIEDKPVKVLILRGGYEKDKPLIVVELKDWYMKDAEHKSTYETQGSWLKKHAEEEGFTKDDEYIGLILGNILLEENFK